MCKRSRLDYYIQEKGSSAVDQVVVDCVNYDHRADSDSEDGGGVPSDGSDANSSPVSVRETAHGDITAEPRFLVRCTLDHLTWVSYWNLVDPRLKQMGALPSYLHGQCSQLTVRYSLMHIVFFLFANVPATGLS